jgi:single-strand DNA-binding protein
VASGSVVAMNEPLITLQGNVGTEIVLRRSGETPVADFRLAVTPRYFDRTTGSWVDTAAQWYSVAAWRALAQHCHASLKVGDPVLVTGRLSQRSYTTRAGTEAVALEVTATGVGHDLTRGTTLFTKTLPTTTPPPTETDTDAARPAPAPPEHPVEVAA